MKKIAIIGGGAAGLIAAGVAGETGADVTLFEKNPVLGKRSSLPAKVGATSRAMPT